MEAIAPFYAEGALLKAIRNDQSVILPPPSSRPPSRRAERLTSLFNRYLDSTPTHSYMKYMCKYPQSVFPYDNLVETNRRRGKLAFEYELINIGVFDEERYFDVFVEYAKELPRDTLIQLGVHNRSPDPAELHPGPADDAKCDLHPLGQVGSCRSGRVGSGFV